MTSGIGGTATILVPGLYGFTPQYWQEVIPQLPPMPGLSALLNLCRRTSQKPADFEFLLGEKFSFGVHEPFPVAALSYLYDHGRPAHSHVLRADPVYLKADRDCLYLLGQESLEVTRQEAKSLEQEINRMYAGDGWSLQIGTPDRWYICMDKKPLIKTFPLHEVFGKNIAGYLPRGKEETKWRVILTELQMLLHNSAVNLHRSMNRQLPINSVWLWGEGELPDHKNGPANTVDYVWSNEALCLGLAQWSKCNSSNVPPNAREWIEQSGTGRHLVVFDDMRLLARERFQSWLHRLTHLDEHWFTPLADAFDKKLLTHIKFETETGLIFETVNRSKWNKPWRKKRLWYEWHL